MPNPAEPPPSPPSSAPDSGRLTEGKDQEATAPAPAGPKLGDVPPPTTDASEDGVPEPVAPVHSQPLGDGAPPSSDETATHHAVPTNEAPAQPAPVHVVARTGGDQVPETMRDPAVWTGLILAGATFLATMYFLYVAQHLVFTGLDEWFAHIKDGKASQDVINSLIRDRAFQMIVMVRITKALGGLALCFLGFSLLVVGIRQPATIDGKTVGWEFRGAGLSPGLIALLAGTYLLATAPEGLKWEHRRGLAENIFESTPGLEPTNDPQLNGEMPEIETSPPE